LLKNALTCCDVFAHKHGKIDSLITGSTIRYGRWLLRCHVGGACLAIVHLLIQRLAHVGL